MRISQYLNKNAILCIKPHGLSKNIVKISSYIDTLVSGSPIIQDGKLIGAVTHVLVDDPTRGFAIFAENMLTAAEIAEQDAAA